ncbi:penicillin amidase [Anopheles sinensis]|uniref:Penicillin amidase n=1 Tax=Anopheles sinensis TaxID=74873 RepID=A0A084VTY3_ANOSI|nr:penicillin amidase [Anopheles sinensis]
MTGTAASVDSTMLENESHRACQHVAHLTPFGQGAGNMGNKWAPFWRTSGPFVLPSCRMVRARATTTTPNGPPSSLGRLGDCMHMHTVCIAGIRVKF